MLEHILIQNFQAHEKLRIDFDSGITTIVGPSDVGKSAVLRALRWVCTNEPGGDAYVRHGARGATVALAVDGHTIKRRRSPGGDTNEYHLDDQAFKAFGRGVPEPVLQLLNLGPVCWQGQHDAPYWFADTAGEVSRQLNSIVNLGVIDDVLGKVAAVRNRAHTRLDVAEENLTAAKKAHDGVQWATRFVIAVQAAEVLEAESIRARGRADAARTLVAEAITSQTARDNATGVAQGGQNAVEKGAEALSLRQRCETLKELAHNATVYRDAAGVDVPLMGTLDDKFKYAGRARAAVVALRELVILVRHGEAAVCLTENDLRGAESLMSGVHCPVCGK